VGLGGGAFAILAKLGASASSFPSHPRLPDAVERNTGGSQVAQGFVFFVLVYLAALVKAQSLRYFGLSLLFIILAFSGEALLQWLSIGAEH